MSKTKKLNKKDDLDRYIIGIKSNNLAKYYATLPPSEEIPKRRKGIKLVDYISGDRMRFVKHCKESQKMGVQNNNMSEIHEMDFIVDVLEY